MFWRIRTKFLIAYITGVALTLAAAFGVSYISFQTAYENINERSTNAEFYQISGEVDMLLSEADTLLLSRIITNSAAEVVARPQR